tara:strand:+ start:84 stop:809 length:726 start_codon:yes stop_codon:yes gene_type:complete
MKKDHRLRLTKTEHDYIKSHRQKNSRNVLVVGDLHCPFDLDSYRDWLIEQYEYWNCSQTIFIGDIIDNHYSSYHETSADGLGGADELDYAIKRIARYYEYFNKKGTKVIIGNHDRIIMRKAQTSAIPSKWIKSYKEVLNVPNWDFVERYVQDGVQYCHGEGGNARKKAKDDMMNTVSGHYHTQCYTEHFVGQNFRVFGCQVGTGIDFSEYSFAYAKYGKKPVIGCAVLLNGKIPLNLLMNL